MAIGATSYPAALDTADTLIRAQNNCPPTTTTDTGGVGANSTTGTTIAVATTTGYPASGTITIDSEIITYSGLTGTTFTGCTRGVDGTTAAAHALGAPVNGFETALHHNVLVNALLALEARLGAGNATRQGTAFPPSPVTGDPFFRTDKGCPYVWDGTVWRVVGVEQAGTVTGAGTTISTLTAVDLASSSVTITTLGTAVILVTGMLNLNNTNTPNANYWVDIDGVAYQQSVVAANTNYLAIPVVAGPALAAGTHTIKLRANLNSGAGTNNAIVTGFVYTYSVVKA